MGNSIPVFAGFFKGVFDNRGNVQVNIIMVGLAGAGKSKILKQFKLGKIVKSTPTIGVSTENVTYKNLRLTVWDVGGNDKIWPQWRLYLSHFITNIYGIIFVIDSADRTKMVEAKSELLRIVNDHKLKHAVLLILANKQDLPDAMSLEEVRKLLGLGDFGDARTMGLYSTGCRNGYEWKTLDNRHWILCECTAPTKEGLYKGMDWMGWHLKQKRHHYRATHQITELQITELLKIWA